MPSHTLVQMPTAARTDQDQSPSIPAAPKLQSRSRKRPRKTGRKPPRSESEKFHATLHALEETAGPNLLDVLRGLARRRREPIYSRHWRLFRKFAYHELPQGAHDYPEMETNDWDDLLLNGGSKRTQQKLRKELVSLAKDHHCGRFRYPTSEQPGYGYIEALTSLSDTVITKTPQSVELFSTIARPINMSIDHPHPLSHRQVFWILQILFAIQRFKSGGFAKTMSLYLFDGGAKQRVIDTLSVLGVCCSYTTTQAMMKGPVASTGDRVRSLGPLRDIVKTYDNFEFSEHQSAERIGNRKVFRSITTALMFRGSTIPIDGLRQGMWRPQSVLRVESILPAPSPSEGAHFRKVWPFKQKRTDC